MPPSKGSPGGDLPQGKGEHKEGSLIAFGREICQTLGIALGREWLETNGRGGYASSTIPCINTRRYHGLLISPVPPGWRRIVFLARLEETVLLGGREYPLSSHQYPGIIHPPGYRHLESFRLDPFPILRYRAGPALLEKRIFMVHGEETTVVQYLLLHGADALILRLRPLLACRDYHSLSRENPGACPRPRRIGPPLILLPYPDLPPLYLHHSGAAFEDSTLWYRNFECPREQERGLDFREDLLSYGVLEFTLTPAREAWIAASLRESLGADPQELEGRERLRRQRLQAIAPSSDPLVKSLTVASDAYLIRSPVGTSGVSAGYPWFTEWGRDALIALPGLTLTTGRFDEAREILASLGRHVEGGLVPNTFPDGGTKALYNSVDVSLWYIIAAYRYLLASDDAAFLSRELWPLLRQIVTAYQGGTLYGIGLAGDGLIRQGEAGLQLTWMDAKVEGRVVTPREGEPIEVQALWYNALRAVAAMARRLRQPAEADAHEALAARARDAALAAFWDADRGFLADVVGPGSVDASLRPNQLLAVALPFPLVEGEIAQRVLETVERDLLTPLGVRTLSPHDPRYRGRYEGNQRARDEAYHQGTAWPWLLGSYFDALRHVRGEERARERLREILPSFDRHRVEAGLGHISEIFDGDPPHTPRGCPAQAWSCAELLRVAAEASSPPGEREAHR